MNELRLGRETPRHYPLIEAYRGRVWRNLPGLYGREVSLFALIATLYGLLLSQDTLLVMGMFALALSVIWTGLSTLWVNARRAQLVREGVWVEGVIVKSTRQRWWHELARGQAHRSFKMTYRYQVPGREKSYTSSIVLCRCAYDRLQVDDRIALAYDAKYPQRSIPLRIAVMKIPH